MWFGFECAAKSLCCLSLSHAHEFQPPRISSQSSIAQADLAEVGVADNPVLVKYTRELEAIGALHLIDVRPRSYSAHPAYWRIFHMPKDHSYVFFSLALSTRTLGFYPARPHIVVHTFFADRSRLVSATGKSRAYRKPRMPNVIVRNFPDITDPDELMQRHRQVLRRVVDEGRRPARPMTADELLQRMIEEYEVSRALSNEYGHYTWSEALRQSFGLMRRELLEE
jgi:hypothetical protein